jgi:hypothetical protein
LNLVKNFILFSLQSVPNVGSAESLHSEKNISPCQPEIRRANKKGPPQKPWINIDQISMGSILFPLCALNSILDIIIFQSFIPFLSVDNLTPNNIQQIIIIKCIVILDGEGVDSASGGLYLKLLEYNPQKRP